MLGPDVVVPQAQRLTQGQLQDLLGPRRERDLTRGDLLTGADNAHDLGPHPLDGDAERFERTGGEPLLLAQQPEQDVLGPDVVVLEGPRLFLGQDDHVAGALGEFLEQSVKVRTALAADNGCRAIRG